MNPEEEIFQLLLERPILIYGLALLESDESERIFERVHKLVVRHALEELNKLASYKGKGLNLHEVREMRKNYKLITNGKPIKKR